MQPDATIYVSGHQGMVGAALTRALRASGYHNLVLATSSELDLRDQASTLAFFESHRPSHVLMAAARVGGILANDTRPAEFIHDNLRIASNVVEAAHKFDVDKMLFLGSSCIYPKHAKNPLSESALLTGALEPTNEFYAVAKIAGIKLCQAYRRQYGCNYISAMPTNLYGPEDNFDARNAHVLAALMRRFHEARETAQGSVTVWGSGKPLREFLHVDDLAQACLHLMAHYEGDDIVNVGSGHELSILELASMIADVVGYDGEIVLDAEKPDGTPRKLVDSSRINAMGWHAQISLRDGIEQTYRWFQHAYASGQIRG